MIQHQYLIKRRGRWTQASAGMVVVRPNHRSILLVHRADRDDWEFPKGRLEPGEIAITAARRELVEETNIKQIKIRPRWCHRISYKFTLPRFGVVHTTVHYYIATTRDRVRLSKENRAYRWATWSEARRLVRHRNYQGVLKKVEKTLKIADC